MTATASATKFFFQSGVSGGCRDRGRCVCPTSAATTAVIIALLLRMMTATATSSSTRSSISSISSKMRLVSFRYSHHATTTSHHYLTTPLSTTTTTTMTALNTKPLHYNNLKVPHRQNLQQHHQQQQQQRRLHFHDTCWGKLCFHHHHHHHHSPSALPPQRRRNISSLLPPVFTSATTTTTLRKRRTMMMIMMAGEHSSETPPPPLQQHQNQLLGSTIASRTDLEKMTIKQLKSYIQEFIIQQPPPPPQTPSQQLQPEQHENNDYDNDKHHDDSGGDGDDNRGKQRNNQIAGDVITIRSLKRKEDYVDYVWNHVVQSSNRRRTAAVEAAAISTTSAIDADGMDGSKNDNTSITVDINSSLSSQEDSVLSTTIKKAKRKKEVGAMIMPPLSLSSTLDQMSSSSSSSPETYSSTPNNNIGATTNSAIPIPSSKSSSSSLSHDSLPSYTTATLTPKDRIVLDVLHRYYPTLIRSPPSKESTVTKIPITTTTTNTMTTTQLDSSTTPSSNLHNNIPQQSPRPQSQSSQQDLLSSISDLLPPNGIGENDIRQIYHPMLVNASQSDMDIVFIGTASCTPGITRGVSCTALRLNWRRRLFSAVEERAVGERGGGVDGNADRDNNGGNSGGTWLFDCGEATQLSVQKTTSIKPGKITKIFLTHCHGDHSFGLPGLLCLMGTDRDHDSPPVEIYGPEGLRMWLRVAIRYSVSRVVPPYRVHELMDVPMAPEWVEGHRKNGRFYYQWKSSREKDDDINGNANDDNDEDDGDVGRNGGKTTRGNTAVGGSRKTRKRWGMQGLAGGDPASWISRAPMMNLEASKDFGEIEGGRDIFPQYNHPQSSNGAPIWEIENNEDDEVTVHAAPMSHGVPCVGYIVQERDRPGRLRPENVLPVIQRNHLGLIEAGVRNPMKIMALIKNLPVGGSYTFPDGTVVRQEDVVEPPRRGRKVVICGDTTDCSAMEGLAKHADVVVHEATNTFLPGVDKVGNMRLVTKDAKIHGHSTPAMAGDFAKRINAKKLVLNHFSARYKGDQSIDSMTIMTRIERQAIKASGLPEDSVAAAWDFMILPVARE